MAEAMTQARHAASIEDVLEGLKSELGPNGYQRILDDHHTVSYVPRGPKLLVSFEKVQDTLDTTGDGMPLGLDFADDKNWSVLHFTADRDTWFRSEAVYAYLDDLVDEAFFENFDQVTFYGTNMGGYAAATFSVVAPGSTVIVMSPQATLDAELTEWDSRFPAARMLDFTDRYGYAPDMIEGTRRAFILYDPHAKLDCVHATLFRGPNVTRLPCRFFENQIARTLFDIDLLHRVVEHAAEGRLTRSGFYHDLRRRRKHRRYLRHVLNHLEHLNRPYLMALFCCHVLEWHDAPAFRRHLRQAQNQLAERGRLPDWLPQPN